MRSQIRAAVAAAVLCLATAGLVGCGSSSTLVGGTPVTPATSPDFTGTVMAGGSTVAGASVQLYAASIGGYGTASTALLSSAVTTDSTGKFTVSGQYTCSSSSAQVYLEARGTGVRSAMVLLTAVGSCGTISSGDTFLVNEVTTSAFVWSMAQFMTNATAVGTSTTNAAGLANAFLTAQVLADVVTGRSPASTIATTVTVESAKVYSLANALAPCASAGTCSALFSAATVGSSVPADTTAAALAIVKHPAANVSAVYQAGATGGPFTGLSSAPSDWTMSLSSTGGGMSSPENVVVDSTGRAWVVNYPGAVNAFTLAGTPVFTTALTSMGLSESIGVTVDPSDNVWVTSGLSNAVMEFSKSGSVLSGTAGYKGGGILYPVSVASDSSGNIWVANNGNSSASKLSSSGVPSQSTGYTAGGALQFVVTVAIDSSGTPWFATEEGAAVHLTSTGSLIRSATCCAIPNGIAVDGNNDAWIADQYGSAIVHVSASTGAIVSTTTTGGVKNPNGIAVDSAGNVWAANGFTGTLTEVSAAGVALSPAFGLGVDAKMNGPQGVALDASGSVWVVSHDDDRLVRFVGLVAPVKTPLVSAPQLP